jgi:Putative Ig domain
VNLNERPAVAAVHALGNDCLTTALRKPVPSSERGAGTNPSAPAQAEVQGTSQCRRTSYFRARAEGSPRRDANRFQINRAPLILLIAATLAVTAGRAFGGGIADEPCPNVAGENTHTCPAATLGTPYHIRFREKEGSGCGPGRQTFYLDSGAAPAGLVLSRDGTLGGTPRETGGFRFYVEMREPENDPATCAGKRTQKQFTLWVRKPLSIHGVPAAIRSEVGVQVRLKLKARGGTGIFNWRTLGGALPKGLRLRAGGWLTGVPRSAGTFELRVSAWDSEGRSAPWIAALDVAPRLTLRRATLPSGKVGRRYDATLRARGGVPSTRWRLLGGSLPQGVRLLASGRFVGIPREAATRRITVQVSDTLGVKAAATFTIAVRARGTASPLDRPRRRRT